MIVSALNLVLAVVILPESAKWLVSQGRMAEAAEAYAYLARVNRMPAGVIE